MGRQVNITVGKRGKVTTDFVGFPGDECYDESESLQGALAHFGIRVGSQQLQPKSTEEIERELESLAGVDSESGKTKLPGPLRRGSV